MKATWSWLLHGWLTAQVILLDSTSNAGSFESQNVCGGTSADGWTLVNGTQTHRWSVGTLAGAYHGSRAIFISDEPDCSTYQYDIAGEDVVHFYRDISVPPGYNYLVVSFYARLQGDRVQAWLYDYLGVYLAPTTITPTPGTLVPNTYRQVGAARISNEWTYFETHTCGVSSGGTYRLIFSWRTTNSNPSPANSGTQPPAAIDCIHVLATNTLPTVKDVPALPFKVGLTSTCGAQNDFTSTNVSPYCNTTNVGYNMYRNGEDLVWRFVPSQSGEIRIQIWGCDPYSHWTLYEGGTPPTDCSTGLSGGTCIAEDIWGGGYRRLYACVNAGQTYYLVFNQTQSTVTATNCGKFDSLLIEPVEVPIYGVTYVANLPYSHGPGSTQLQRNRFDNSNSGACGNGIYNGGPDWIWQFTPSTSGNLTINITGSSTYTGWALYCQGQITCSDGLDNAACVAGGISGGGNININSFVQAGITYYFILNHYGSGGCTFDDLTISAPTPATPPSSYPCMPLTQWITAWEGEVLNNGTHRLLWRMAPSLQVRRFVVEAGNSPLELTPLDSLPPHSTEYFRIAPPPGPIWYRLRVQTSEGSLLTSSLLRLESSGTLTPAALSAYVNAGNVLQVRLQGWKDRPLTIEMYDLQGRRLFKQDLPRPVEVVTLSLTHLSPGLYYVWAYQEGYRAKAPVLVGP